MNTEWEFYKKKGMQSLVMHRFEIFADICRYRYINVMIKFCSQTEIIIWKTCYTFIEQV